MTITITSYQTRIQWITGQWKTKKISRVDFVNRRKLLKRRLKTTLKVQKLRARKGKPGCVSPAAIKKLLSCNTCAKAAGRIKRKIKKQAGKGGPKSSKIRRNKTTKGRAKKVKK